MYDNILCCHHNLSIMYDNILCCPQNLTIVLDNILCCPQNLTIVYDNILCCHQNLTVVYDNILCCSQNLTVVYDKILRTLKKMPTDASYRRHTEVIIQERLGHVKAVSITMNHSLYSARLRFYHNKHHITYAQCINQTAMTFFHLEIPH